AEPDIAVDEPALLMLERNHQHMHLPRQQLDAEPARNLHDRLTERRTVSARCAVTRVRKRPRGTLRGHRHLPHGRTVRASLREVLSPAQRPHDEAAPYPDAAPTAAPSPRAHRNGPPPASARARPQRPSRPTSHRPPMFAAAENDTPVRQPHRRP